MKVKRLKFATTNIDEAAYYAVKGHKYAVESIGEKRGMWTFTGDSKLEAARKQFWGGRADVNLHKWLTIRTMMKYEQGNAKLLPKKSKPVRIPKVIGIAWQPASGDTYYYIDDAGKVESAVYGINNPVHIHRLYQGKIFKNSVDAAKSRNDGNG